MIFDSHHAHIEEKSSSESILSHADLIKHVHITESDRGTPGSGQVRWNEIFSSLVKIGYDGWLTIEAFSRNKAEFASGINVWRNFQPTLEEVYKDGLSIYPIHVDQSIACLKANWLTGVWFFKVPFWEGTLFSSLLIPVIELSSTIGQNRNL